jgi:hypothetical protein
VVVTSSDIRDGSSGRLLHNFYSEGEIEFAISNPQNTLLFITLKQRDDQLKCYALKLTKPDLDFIGELCLDSRMDHRNIHMSASIDSVALMCYDQHQTHITIWHQESLNAITTLTMRITLMIPRFALGFSSFAITGLMGKDRYVLLYEFDSQRAEKIL